MEFNQTCECPKIIEQTAENYAVAIDPSVYPDGVPVHPDASLGVVGIWIHNQSVQTLTLYLGYRSAKTLTDCFSIPPGGDKFFGVDAEVEKAIAIPKTRLFPGQWKLNSTAAMSAVVILFL